MEKVLLVVVIFLTSLQTPAQQIRLNAYGAYVFEDGFDFYFDNNNYYNGQINGGFQWGAGFEYMLNPAVCVELMYLRRDTKAPVNYQAGLTSERKQTDLEVDLNYVLIGSDFHAENSDGKVEGYGGIFAGISFPDVSNPDNDNTSSASKFTWAIRLGGNVWISEKVGLKLQSQLLTTFNGSGGSVYFGSYPGGIAMNNYNTTFQLGLGGGLTFRLGKGK